ncbi:MAG: DUF721 domain-containing protein, partial [Armatimonadetes bacterium]|nr:DUF721 domain-containing protein [Armatimonadota bacterium]
MAIENLRTGGGLSDLGQLLAPLLGQRGGADLLALLQLQALWREVVGAQLARQSRPAELRAGKLTITVSSATWNSTLRSM